MHLAMGSLITSLHGWYQLSLLMNTVVFLLLSTHCTATEISYTDHCASFVPESPTTAPEFASLPFRPFQYGYYAGGDRILNPNPSEYYSPNNNILLFQTQNVYRTDAEGIFNVHGILNFDGLNMNYYGHGMTYGHSVFSPLRNGETGALDFSLKGFWSISTGKLCMVGSTTSYSREGNLLHHPAVLKLNGIKNSSSITSLVTGTLQSLSSADDPSYFEPVSLLIFPPTNYQYTNVLKEIEKGSSGAIVVSADSLSLQVSTPICSILTRSVNEFRVEYARDCNSSENCSPFDDDIGYLPRVMSLNMIQCSPDGQSSRFLLEFPNSSYVGYYRYFNPNTTFLAEGSWDWKKNQLYAVACRILNTDGSLDKSHVDDCSIRLTLRFPAIWSIRETTSTLGQIWSNKAPNDSGYFETIVLRSTDTGYNDMLRVPGLKYEYTAMEKVRNMSCLKKKPPRNSVRNYPDGFSQEMRFDMSVKTAGGEIAWGYSDPISVGDQISQLSGSSSSWSSSRPAISGVQANASSKPLNISYKISLSTNYDAKLDGVQNLFNISSSEDRGVKIFAEGIYDSETGGLCMVGCRYVGRKYQKLINDSMDCEIKIRLQFPSLNSKKNGVFIRGTIASSRNKSDPLYFEPLFVSATAYYTILERQSIWRMDLEIIMVLVSNTLACVFVVFQLLYVKKHPGVLPFTSILMLVILTVGHMILLVLNFEALFFQDNYRRTVLLGSGGWIKVHEVIVRVVTMVAFLLQFRLLQFSLSARMRENNQKALWMSEKKALYVSLPLYVAGAFITLLANWRKYKFGMATQSFRFNNHQHSLWGDLRSYAGLILDSFLFPQILLNIFHNSREYSLSRYFYIGLTIVRLVPHAYDLYRAQNYFQNFDGSYIYADPAADFYSTAWDVTIPLVSLLFAAIIYLQQRFGGRCFLPLRFRELEVYEKIPTTGEE
ncbi:DUF2921 family protein [Melia azedarach]|uniref:DUF2921 family protein n=1 Tax=Melia azedarach TaxID=155640 RepID=A0ACC1YRY5_MELAZ|nr:DUF2921 family protein [Melia azedarach]